MKILEVLTRNREIGNLGEKRAARHLWLRGYKILRRNYVAVGNEIDIIAIKGDTLVFCEVKTRNLNSIGRKEPRAASAVTREKQRKILAVANHFKGFEYKGKRMRFDVIEVYYENKNGRDKITKINHMIGAFDYDTAYGMPQR